MRSKLRIQLENEQAELRQEKQYRLQTSALCSLVNSLGVKYGITANPANAWYWDGNGHRQRHEVYCKLEGTASYGVYLSSAELIENTVLLDKILRCQAIKLGLATGVEYAEVANYFEIGLYVETRKSIVTCLYNRAIEAGYHPAVVSLFKLRCEDSCNFYEEWYAAWDGFYRHYKRAVEKGFTEEDLKGFDPRIIYAIRVEQKAEQGDTDAIREIARHYYYHTCNKTAYSKYMRRLADKGEADGILYKSRYLFHKKGTIAQKALGLTWHMRGIDLGDAECMYRAGRIYELLAEGLPWTMKNAIHFHEMAAQNGILESMRRLARIYAQEGTAYYDKNKAEYYRDKLIEFGG